MQFADIARHAPEQIFLVQGSEHAFDRLLAEAIVSDPLVQSLSVPRFTIEHARALALFIVEGTGQARTFFVFFSVFSADAAQVLLKSFEEPDFDTTIVLMTPYPYTTPITIRSRVRMVHSDPTSKEERAFTITVRDDMLALIKSEFGTDAEDGAATRRARAVELLDALEVYIREDPHKARTIYEAKKMLFKANMPTKFVLEYAVSVVL